jgi:hypothetical protein
LARDVTSDDPAMVTLPVPLVFLRSPVPNADNAVPLICVALIPPVPIADNSPVLLIWTPLPLLAKRAGLAFEPAAKLTDKRNPVPVLDGPSVRLNMLMPEPVLAPHTQFIVKVDSEIELLVVGLAIEFNGKDAALAALHQEIKLDPATQQRTCVSDGVELDTLRPWIWSAFPADEVGGKTNCPYAIGIAMDTIATRVIVVIIFMMGCF